MSGSRVLIVEDQVTQREILRAFLEFYGFQIGEARNGEEALSLLDAFEPDLLITDLVMTGMGGLELIRRVRSTPGWTDLPIVLCSASEELRVGSVPAEASVHLLTKPYSGDGLADLVRRVLGGSRFRPPRSAGSGKRGSPDGGA